MKMCLRGERRLNLTAGEILPCSRLFQRGGFVSDLSFTHSSLAPDLQTPLSKSACSRLSEHGVVSYDPMLKILQIIFSFAEMFQC
jgi:hypothetical protein